MLDLDCVLIRFSAPSKGSSLVFSLTMKEVYFLFLANDSILDLEILK